MSIPLIYDCHNCRFGPLQLHRSSPGAPDPEALKFKSWDTGSKGFRNNQNGRVQARITVHLIAKMEARHLLGRNIACVTLLNAARRVHACDAGTVWGEK